MDTSPPAVSASTGPSWTRIWFGDPADEYVCEETGDEVVLMKDRNGTVIGFEKLNYTVPGAEGVQFTFDTAAA